MPFFTYFSNPKEVKHKKIEEWALNNIGARGILATSWNWIGMPGSDYVGQQTCIGIRLPNMETLLAFKISFPYELYGDFETLETFTYEDIAADRSSFGIK